MKKRAIATLLAAATAFTLTAGCGKKTSYGEEVPVYVSDEEFYFGTWVGIGNSVQETNPDTGEKVSRALTDEEFDEQYRLLKEAGFNHTIVSNYERAFPVADKYGVKLYLAGSPINSWLMNDVAEEAVVEENLRNLYEEYSKHPSFAGVNIVDEPSFEAIKNYSEAKKRFDKIFTEKTFYINLFPSVAGPSLVSDDYKAYIREYVDKIGTDYISYDHYPLKYNSKGENYIVPTFLYNMEVLQEVAPEKKHWTFLQSIQYTPNNRTLTSVADATFQAYSFLAFGGDGIQWFCYWTPGDNAREQFGEACIGRDGKPTAIYDYVKTTNNEIHAFEDIYFNFDWKGVMTTVGTKNEDGENDSFSYLSSSLIKAHPRMKSIKTEQDTLTGVFKDKEGRDGFMVVNYTEPSLGLKNKVELTFKDCKHALVVKKGVPKEVETKNGKLSFTMDAGEGYFIIPLK